MVGSPSGAPAPSGASRLNSGNQPDPAGPNASSGINPEILKRLADPRQLAAPEPDRVTPIGSETNLTTLKSLLTKQLAAVGVTLKSGQFSMERGSRGGIQGTNFSFSIEGIDESVGIGNFGGFIADGGELTLRTNQDGSRTLALNYGTKSTAIIPDENEVDGSRESMATSDIDTFVLDPKGKATTIVSRIVISSAMLPGATGPEHNVLFDPKDRAPFISLADALKRSQVAWILRKGDDGKYSVQEFIGSKAGEKADEVGVQGFIK